MSEKERSVQHRKIVLSLICEHLQKAYESSAKFKLDNVQKAFSAYPVKARITITPPKNKN